MKKLLYIIIGLSLPVIASAQLKNLDFESWENPVNPEKIFDNNPTGWACSNRWLGTELEQFSPSFNMPIDTNAQHDKYALRLFVWYNYMKDAAFQIAPIDYKPTELKGLYKYENNLVLYGNDSIVDTAQVIVMLSKWNKKTATRDTVGLGTLSINKESLLFKDFHVAINYFSPSDPDSIAIFLDPSVIGRDLMSTIQHGGTGVCSQFTIDNLVLAQGSSTGINGIIPYLAITVHPNPTTDILQFESISGVMNIYDITGQCVSSLYLKDANSIDVSHLNRGVYFMVINTEKETRTSKFVKR